MMKTNKASSRKANKILLNSLVLAALAAPGMAVAADAPASPHTFTANIGLVNNYVFRGITQTVEKPALQGGFDYTHVNGFYAGIWGSNVSWIIGSGATGDAGLELDTYAGFKNSFAEDFSYDVGFVRYNYPGTYTPPATYAKADTSEIYGAMGYKWISAKYSYALGQFLTVPGASGTSYLEVNASYPVNDTGMTLGAHYGKQTYKGSFADNLAALGNTATYSDYKLGVSKDFNGYMLGTAYTIPMRAKAVTTLTPALLGWPRTGGVARWWCP
jgi:uncharacterized protein (TIGR02001 family)